MFLNSVFVCDANWMLKVINEEINMFCLVPSLSLKKVKWKKKLVLKY